MKLTKDEVEQHYDDVSSKRKIMALSKHAFFYPVVYGYSIDQIKPFEKDDLIIDIGSSFGGIESQVTQDPEGDKIIFHISDISKVMLSHSLLPDDKKHHDDIQNSTIPDNTYDKLMCIAVIPHLKDPISALKHMYRILKPGGIGSITFANKYSFSNLFHWLGIDYYSRHNIKAPIDDKQSMWEAKRMCEEVGFEILEIGHDWFLPPSIPFRLKSQRVLRFGHLLGYLFKPFVATYYMKVKKRDSIKVHTRNIYR